MEMEIAPPNHERYPVQSHGGRGTVDLEYAEDGWPILTATNDKSRTQGISREFRWAYGNRVWLVHTNGEKVLYEGITQCWLDEDDRVYAMVARPVYSAWLDL